MASSFTRLPSDSRITLASVLRFVRLATFARPYLSIHQHANNLAPVLLPHIILETLSSAMEWSEGLVAAVWDALRDEIWVGESAPASSAEIYEYNRFALEKGTSYRHLFPPTKVCLSPQCSSHTKGVKRALVEPRSYKASLFTVRDGPLPIYVTTLYCRKCQTHYHTDYHIHKSQRTYYGGIPDIIQVAQHFFIENALLELFVAGQVFGWISATNWARIYNHALAPPQPHIRNNEAAFAMFPVPYRNGYHYPNWQFSLSIRPEDVLNGFFLYSLLIDKAEHGWILSLPHNESSQVDRLQSALSERNGTMEGVGQDAYPHVCNLCCHISEDENGELRKIQAAVCDGNNMGHPCCGVHDCKTPLVSRNDRFCPNHRKRNLKCAIDDCDAPICGRFRTCEDPTHRQLESRYFAKGVSVPQLHSRLLRATGVVVPNDSTALHGDATEPDEHGVIESCEEKPIAPGYTKRKLRACFGTNYTHTELLFMRPCGVILSRATLYGSEAISAVNLAARATFPTPNSTPEYLFYDSNCKLVAHQKANNDTHFARTAQPVDVFHFRTKHKETDTFCQQHCNPAAFPELLDANGNWRFNTSICEQTNVWLGGYTAILRNMEVTRYNFYLDEMIKRRNRYVIQELERKGHMPWNVPFDDLFSTVHVDSPPLN
ncbi:hypothetical protein PTI98_010474 [Pleurotus ostreatus]|nr:hypothetical protein PTI98_010474 [Pleurotus ostreatus]